MGGFRSLIVFLWFILVMLLFIAALYQTAEITFLSSDLTSARNDRDGLLSSYLKERVRHEGFIPISGGDLNLIADIYGLQRILIFNATGVVVSDTGGEKPLPWWYKKSTVESTLKLGDRYEIRKKRGEQFGVSYALFAWRGKKYVMVAASPRPERKQSYSTYFLSAAILVVIALTAVYFSRSRRTVKSTLTGQDAEGNKSEVGFVVDTFQDVVTRLKAKEDELQVLRTQAERRADNLAEYSENILQSVPSGVITLDKDGLVARINASVTAILGLRPEEVEGTSPEECFPQFSELLKGAEPVERGELSYTAKGGKRKWLGFSLAPLLDSDSNVIGKTLVFTDLTELKALEAQAALRERLSSLGEMAAGVAHELRNPMGVIAGYTKLLSKKVDENLKPTVSAISKEVTAMDIIINDFLSFARPKSPNLSTVELKPLLEESAEAAIGNEPFCTIKLNVDEDLSIVSDEVMLKQVFVNLIKNASEAVENNGGVITITGSRTYSGVRITVSDNGHGVPEGLRQNIFLPFFTTREGGTGLGLALVHGIVTTLNGKVEMESSPEKTTFTVLLG